MNTTVTLDKAGRSSFQGPVLPFSRYVAMGDSTTEGLDDPDGAGGFRGWANRFAELVAGHQARTDGPQLLYANLAVRGLKTRAILEHQLERAVAMQPDLATVVSGTNDVLRPTFDIQAYQRDVEHMHRALIEQGATVLTFTLPDLSSVNPTARLARARVLRMNEALREVSRGTGAIVVDLAREGIARDMRLWSADRLHANSLGHARIAAALAHAVQLPGSDAGWATPLDSEPQPSAANRWASHVRWTAAYLVPWLGRRLRRRSSSDGVRCKRPMLLPVTTVVE